MLTDLQRRALVEVARQSAAARVAGRPLIPTGPEERWLAPLPERCQPPLDLPQASGVFVTLKRAGQLRGCLGTLKCLRDLIEEVARCAADAASEDHRFSPVTAAEFPEVSVEVSVLGPLERIDPTAPDAVTIGRHGLVIEQGRQRGVLLPQVASEWQWTPEQFLRHTCLKANLAPDAWQHGASVYRFVAEVFGD